MMKNMIMYPLIGLGGLGSGAILQNILNKKTEKKPQISARRLYKDSELLIVKRHINADYAKMVYGVMEHADIMHQEFVFGEVEQDMDKKAFIIRKFRFKEGAKDIMESIIFSNLDSLMGATSSLKARQGCATAHLGYKKIKDYKLGEDYVAVVRSIGDDGRNIFPTTKVYDSSGDIVAEYEARFVRVPWTSTLVFPSKEDFDL